MRRAEAVKVLSRAAKTGHFRESGTSSVMPARRQLSFPLPLPLPLPLPAQRQLPLLLPLLLTLLLTWGPPSRATRRQGLKRIKKRPLSERSEFRTLPVSGPGGACTRSEAEGAIIGVAFSWLLLLLRQKK